MASDPVDSRHDPQHNAEDDESVPLQSLSAFSSHRRSASMNRDSSEEISIAKNRYSTGNMGAAEETAASSNSSKDAAAHQRERPMNVRRHKTALLLLAPYFLLLVIPFPLTCIMNQRPLKLPSYINFRSTYRYEDFDFNYRAQVVVRVMNSIRAVSTVPLIGVILAQAAIIHMHKRTASAKSKKLSLAETFRLADRGWTVPQHFWRAVLRRQGFIPFGALVLLLFAIAQPFEQLFVGSTTLKVMTRSNNYAWEKNETPNLRIIGTEPSPNAMGQAPLYQVVQAVSNAITAKTGMERNEYLWIGGDGSKSFAYANPNMADQTDGNDEQPFWASSLTNGTTTGILRQHAMRLNSSIKCDNISANDFPTPCPGEHPFVTDWSHEHESTHLSLRVCAPGDYRQTAWTHSRDRQDIREELYIDVSTTTLDDSWTIRCLGATSRGYFELGNHFNGQVPQPLLTKWPALEEMRQNFVDYEETDANIQLLTANDNYTGYINFPGYVPPEYQFISDHDEPFRTPGPLLTSTIAVFGNQSFVGTIANNPAPRALAMICADPKVPFLNFYYGVSGSPPFCQKYVTPGSDLSNSLVWWLGSWRDMSIVESYMDVSMFFANQATLSIGSNNYGYTPDGDPRGPRKIYTSEGYTTQKPTASLASIIFLGVLYSLQLITLIGFAIYIGRNSTWARELNSFSIAHIVAKMDKDSQQEVTRSYEEPGRQRRLSEIDSLAWTRGERHGES